jgi:hypothetical protein
MPFFLAALAIPLLKAAAVIGAASIAAKVVGKATGSKTLVKLGKIGTKIAIGTALVGGALYAGAATGLLATAPAAATASGTVATGAAVSGATQATTAITGATGAVGGGAAELGAVTSSGIMGSVAPAAAPASGVAGSFAQAAGPGVTPFIPSHMQTVAPVVEKVAESGGVMESVGKYVNDNPLLSFGMMSTGGSILSSLFAGTDAKKARKQQAQQNEAMMADKNVHISFD